MDYRESVGRLCEACEWFVVKMSAYIKVTSRDEQVTFASLVESISDERFCTVITCY
ncbi:hypothetical protein NTGM5_320006 [Candidatus Nitrotoga sp. M5]|nr:hypothetical protein NTGM5_320006 [Candidatus Nitrotoga sp. M5]